MLKALSKLTWLLEQFFLTIILVEIAFLGGAWVRKEIDQLDYMNTPRDGFKAAPESIFDPAELQAYPLEKNDNNYI